MKKIGLIILAFICLSCDGEPIEEGVVTSIEGKIYDNTNELPFEDLKIKIAEYKIRRGSIYTHTEFIQWIDSTYTDQNGDFFLEFETSGRGDLYEFHVESRPDVWDYYQRVFEIPYIGKKLKADLDFLHLYPIKLIIEMNNVEHLPVKLYPRYYQQLEEINTASGTVERIIYADKNSDTRIHFSRRVGPNESEIYADTIPATNTSTLTTYNISLNNSDFKPNE